MDADIRNRRLFEPRGADPAARDGDELEIKLRLAPRHASRLFLHPAIESARVEQPRRVRMLGVYYDTRDAALMKLGLALRLRKEGNVWVQTIKGPAEAPGAPGMHARREFEWPRGDGSVPSLDLDALSTTPWADAIAAVGDRLAPLFETSFVRKVAPLVLADGTRVELVLDRGYIRTMSGARWSQPVCEVEIELEEGSLAAIYAFAQTLASDMPLAVEPRSKAERGYLLAGALAPRAERAKPPVHGIDASVVDAMRAILAECASHIVRNAELLALHGSPDSVHQTRVGLRRLRSALRMLRGHALPDELAAIEDRARSFARALGAARDLHVMRHDVLPRIVADVEDAQVRRAVESAASGLGPGLDQAEAEAVHAARRVARSRALHRFVLALGALASAPRFGLPAGHEDALSGTASAFAVRLLEKRYRRLKKLGRALHRASAEERHEARIATKRLRYAAEFFGSLFAAPRTKAFIDALSQLQDALGHDNDAHEALRIVARMAGRSSASAQLLTQGAHAGRRARTNAIVKAWSRFTACEPGWRDSPSPSTAATDESYTRRLSVPSTP